MAPEKRLFSFISNQDLLGVWTAVNAAAASVAVTVTSAVEAEEEDEPDEQPDHRCLRRKTRRLFKHHEALQCIMRDYLGPVPLFLGKEFKLMFRISRTRFEQISQDFPNNFPFFRDSADCTGMVKSSLQAKILLPLKTLAYGVPPHTFCDYFQMSHTHARSCVHEFEKAMLFLYEKEYLRLPDVGDLKAIVSLHRAKHHVSGMFGSLDCMHVFWKNCPVAWQGQYKGKEKKPSVVLEAICDHHLWFWHASFGYPGTLNDINIINLSPFLESLRNGTFAELEKKRRSSHMK
jgi:hypothetical protein